MLMGHKWNFMIGRSYFEHCVCRSISQVIWQLRLIWMERKIESQTTKFGTTLSQSNIHSTQPTAAVVAAGG